MVRIISLIIFLFTNQINAENIGKTTGFKIPRFVSLKSNDVNLRVGPSKNYPKILNYKQKNLPIEIIKEHADWRLIQDIDGNSGWILGSLLKGDRYGIIISNSNEESKLFNFPKGNQIGIIGKNNIIKIKKCLTQWCLIQYKKNKGWIKKENIWGVYKDEIYKINFTQPLIEIYWKIMFHIK
jgi:SH3-like domain-containing protein